MGGEHVVDEEILYPVACARCNSYIRESFRPNQYEFCPRCADEVLDRARLRATIAVRPVTVNGHPLYCVFVDGVQVGAPSRFEEAHALAEELRQDRSGMKAAELLECAKRVGRHLTCS